MKELGNEGRAAKCSRPFIKALIQNSRGTPIGRSPASSAVELESRSAESARLGPKPHSYATVAQYSVFWNMSWQDF